MKVTVIDANIFQAFYYEEITGNNILPGRTGPASPVFKAMGNKAVVYLDDSKQIETEWISACKGGEEWFCAWLGDQLALGNIFEIQLAKFPSLKGVYSSLGMPATRDIWYLRTLFSLVKIMGNGVPCLLSEDIDFYDPSMKAAPHKTKLKHFIGSVGPVAKKIKKDGGEVLCIDTYSNTYL